MEPLTRLGSVHVIVVDNGSNDGSLEAVSGLDVERVPLGRNVGFARGCNAGWRRGSAPYVLFVNPDARIGATSLTRLIAALEGDANAGAAAPKILNPDGTLAYSLRRFPRLRSTFAQALFLHRVFPRAAWTDELIRDQRCYAARCNPDWVSGACLLVRRSVLQAIGGWDERFFLFGEDIDLCRRIHDAGHSLVFEPAAECRHVGGASAGKETTLALLTEGRLTYIAKYHGPLRASAERLGMVLGAMTHIAAGRRGTRIGHVRSLLALLSIARPTPS
jgi:GT2 family glycosyltransferase